MLSGRSERPGGGESISIAISIPKQVVLQLFN